MDFKDTNGSWIRPMEQRFRLLALGWITAEAFLDMEVTFVLEEKHLLPPVDDGSWGPMCSYDLLRGRHKFTSATMADDGGILVRYEMPMTNIFDGDHGPCSSTPTGEGRGA